MNRIGLIHISKTGLEKVLSKVSSADCQSSLEMSEFIASAILCVLFYFGETAHTDGLLVRRIRPHSPVRAQPLGLIKPCSCGIYARLYTLIHRRATTLFRGFFQFMNADSGTPQGARIVRQYKARTWLEEPPTGRFSTSLSTGVERRVVGQFGLGGIRWAPRTIAPGCAISPLVGLRFRVFLTNLCL